MSIDSMKRAVALLRDGYIQQADETLMDAIEAIDKPDRHPLQANGEHPAPCARFCEANAFRIAERGYQRRIEELQVRVRELVTLQERWNYIDKRANVMSTSKYEALCSVLHIEVDEEKFDIGEAIDKEIAAKRNEGQT